MLCTSCSVTALFTRLLLVPACFLGRSCGFPAFFILATHVLTNMHIAAKGHNVISQFTNNFD